MSEIVSVAAAQALRLQSAASALAHIASMNPVTPGEASGVLEELAVAAARLSDAARSIGNGMRVSLATHQIVDDSGADPSPAIVAAQAHLQVAADLLARVCESVWDAHSKTASLGLQGVRAADRIVF
ncbi:hypothetical protein [Microbacterium enclense]|uniref:hypothetical protein n=1 Tax=Microbacterium enclense TaxID=993073 RepID=UPI003F804580